MSGGRCLASRLISGSLILLGKSYLEAAGERSALDSFDGSCFVPFSQLIKHSTRLTLNAIESFYVGFSTPFLCFFFVNSHYDVAL